MIKNRLDSIIKSLATKGFEKQANQLLDLKKRLDLKKQQRELAEEIKEEARMEEIFKQHEKDKPYLRFPEEKSQAFYPQKPESLTTSRPRWEVQVRYPQFEEDGSVFFSEDSLEDFYTVDQAQLEELKKEEELGYIQVVSTRLIQPKTNLK